MAINESKVSKMWDKNAEGWVMGVRSGWDRFRKLFHDPAFFQILGAVSDKDVIDLGCGEGITSRQLADRGARVTGIDLSSALIQSAQDEEKRDPKGISYKVDSFSELKTCSDESCDRAVSIMAFMDSPGLEEAFNSAWRVLRPSGELIFSVAHPICDRKVTSFERNDTGKPVALKVADYFATDPWEDKWGFTPPDGQKKPSPFHIACFPRTISDYFNGLVNSGFEIVMVSEPKPDEEVCKNDPSNLLSQWLIAPFYLMVKARKGVRSAPKA